MSSSHRVNFATSHVGHTLYSVGQLFSDKQSTHGKVLNHQTQAFTPAVSVG